MKITDLKVTVLGDHPIVRLVTDEGIDGYGQVEWFKPYLKPQILFYRDLVLGLDPTNVERVMINVRRMGAFKPWGSAVSAIEMALWDIAGKAAGVPVYKLLGGKIRDKVRVYNGAVRFKMTEFTPEAYRRNYAKDGGQPRRSSPSSSSGISFHSPMYSQVPGFTYGEIFTKVGIPTEAC